MLLWARRLLHNRRLVVGLGLLLVGLVGLADWRTGDQVDLAVFYFLPLLLVGWWAGRRAALLIALASVTSGLAGDYPMEHFTNPAIPYWNALVRLCAMVVVAYAFSALHRAYDSLRHEERLREDLTNMLVHDLKNPLSAAGMALNLIRRMPCATEAEVAERDRVYEIALNSQHRAEDMIEEILHVARARASGGPMPLNLGPVDLAAIARAALRDLAPQVARRALRLQEELPPTCPSLTGDAARLRRVVDNLLSNAVKHSPDGGAVTLSLREVGAELRLTVCDQGPGVPPELRDRIFEKFAQANSPAQVGRLSVGLGLTFSHLAVQSHGGRIWVDSAPGGGAAFTFALPLSNRPPNPGVG